MRSGRRILVLLLLLASPGVRAGDRPAVRPFEGAAPAPGDNPVDAAVRRALARRGLEPAPPCSDEVFVRRVHLDVIGTLPSPAEVVSFLADREPSKRARLVDALLEREEFADYAALRWCDVLRVKAEYPIRLWPNAVQAYHRWIRDAVRRNLPYDRFVRELLTASGSNFRVPAANFWRATQSRDPRDLASAVALTFLGERIERWPEARQAGFAAFFSRVAFKQTVEWKEEIVHCDPAPCDAVQAILPDGMPVGIDADRDPRQVFAAWLVRPDNARFAHVVVNRIWAWLMGRGIVHEPDDFRPDNPPAVPGLLDVLARRLVVTGYDLRQVYRLVLNSATYQQSSIPACDDPRADALFARYPVRRLDAEVLIDAVCAITGTTEEYSSAVPEPFTFVPEDERTIALADGSISSTFLETFGRPARDTGLWAERNNGVTAAQRLHLLNSADILARIERSPRLGAIAWAGRGNPRGAAVPVYLLVLSRPPTAEEVAAVARYAQDSKLAPRQVVNDVVWALINSKEFLHAH